MFDMPRPNYIIESRNSVRQGMAIVTITTTTTTTTKLLLLVVALDVIFAPVEPHQIIRGGGGSFRVKRKWKSNIPSSSSPSSCSKQWHSSLIDFHRTILLIHTHIPNRVLFKRQSNRGCCLETNLSVHWSPVEIGDKSRRIFMIRIGDKQHLGIEGISGSITNALHQRIVMKTMCCSRH